MLAKAMAGQTFRSLKAQCCVSFCRILKISFEIQTTNVSQLTKFRYVSKGFFSPTLFILFLPAMAAPKVSLALTYCFDIICLVLHYISVSSIKPKRYFTKSETESIKTTIKNCNFSFLS